MMIIIIIITLLTGFEPATSGLEVQCAIHCATRAYMIIMIIITNAFSSLFYHAYK